MNRFRKQVRCFEGRKMAQAGHDLSLPVRDGLCKSDSHLRCGTAIALTGEDQRGRFDLRSSFSGQRMCLSEQPVRLEVTSEVVREQSLSHGLGFVGMRGLPLRREPPFDSQVGHGCESLLLGEFQSLPHPVTLALTATEDCAHQHRAVDSTRVTSRNRQSDQTAQRQADNIAALDSVGVEHLPELHDKIFESARPGRIFGFAVTQKVVSQNPVLLRQGLDHRIPHGVIKTDTVYQNQRRSCAVNTAERRVHGALSNPISSMSEYLLPIR